MDVQHALLSKVVLDSDVSTAVNARITTEFFTDDKYRRVWEYILDHWHKYGDSPGEQVLALAFPSYKWKQYGESIEYFIDLLRQRRKKSILTDALNRSAGYLQASDDPDAIDMMERALHDALVQVRLDTATTLDMDLTQTVKEVEALLEERMLDPGYLRGISTGFKGIDYVTGGLQPEHLIALIGLPKSLKSSTLLYMALACHQQAKVPLFIGFEMSNTEQLDRTLSLISGVGLSKIKNGSVTTNEQRQVIRSLKLLEEMRPFVFSVDLDATMTVSGLQAKAMEYQPDALFVDGAYLMESELPQVEQGSPRALSNIARSLKRLGQTLRIPVVITTQATSARARRGVLTADSGMYTQAWRQSADVLLGSERVEEESSDTVEVMVNVKVLDSRNGPRATTQVVWDWSSGSVIENRPDWNVGGGDDSTPVEKLHPRIKRWASDVNKDD